MIAPHFKRRLSGVTSTIIQLVPLQAQTLAIATLGPGLPAGLPAIGWRSLPGILRKPAGRPFRIWHARRNVEMLAGLVFRDVLRAPLRLVFTSASQRRHKRWTKFLIRRMDAVIATSHKTAAYLDVPNTVIMHGIDTEKFAPPTDRGTAVAGLGLDPAQSYVGCFGRIRHQKGTDQFVDAMMALLPRHPGWSAIVAGRATAQNVAFERGLIERVAEAGLENRIQFVGEHADIARWYSALTLFVAPQRWEGFGMTPLEAMASGVPVVATDAGAFGEMIVENETGAVVPAGDGEALRDAIRPYLADPALAQAHGGNALDHIKANFPLGREAESIRRVYDQLWARG